MDRRICTDVRKSDASLFITESTIMDTEHINQIGTTLEDLAQRTQALRGYL